MGECANSSFCVAISLEHDRINLALLDREQEVCRQELRIQDEPFKCLGEHHQIFSARLKNHDVSVVLLTCNHEVGLQRPCHTAKANSLTNQSRKYLTMTTIQQVELTLNRHCDGKPVVRAKLQRPPQPVLVAQAIGLREVYSQHCGCKRGSRDLLQPHNFVVQHLLKSASLSSLLLAFLVLLLLRNSCRLVGNLRSPARGQPSKNRDGNRSNPHAAAHDGRPVKDACGAQLSALGQSVVPRHIPSPTERPLDSAMASARARVLQAQPDLCA